MGSKLTSLHGYTLRLIAAVLPSDPITASHRQLVTEVRDALSALAGGEDRVHSGVRTAGYQFTADLVVHRGPDGAYTETDGPRVTRLVGRLIRKVMDSGHQINRPGFIRPVILPFMELFEL